MLTLPDLIEQSGVELTNYKIHCATGKSPHSPLEAFFDGTFQSWQERQNQLNFKCDQVVGLIHLSPAKWLFAGLYRVLGYKEGRPDDLLPISVPLQVRESGSSCLAVFSRCERSERLLNTACRECGGGHVIQRTMPSVVVVVKTPTVNHVAGFLQA